MTLELAGVLAAVTLLAATLGAYTGARFAIRSMRTTAGRQRRGIPTDRQRKART